MIVAPPDPQSIDLFMSLFRGRMDVYAHRWERDGSSGYSPAYKFDWDEFNGHRRRGGSLKDFENKRLVPFSRAVVKRHLLGADVIGVYPILPDNTSYFLAADFDGEAWKSDATRFVETCARVGLRAYLERSRSGVGGHVWIFFSEPIPCHKSRRIGLKLIRRAFSISEFEKEVSFDRLFPNQDTLSHGKFGNLIALPLQGRSAAEGNTVFIDFETGRPYPDQWKALQEAKRHSMAEIDAVYQELLVNNQSVPSGVARLDGALSICVRNQIVLPRPEIGRELAAFLKEELNFLNTEYLTKRRLGKSTYKVQKYYKLIEESGDLILLPRGFLSRLKAFLSEHKIGHSLRREHASLEEVSFKSSIRLTPAQKYVVDSASAYQEGVIVAPSGSGKTIIGLELVSRRRLPALILVHRKQILDQWVDRIQTFLAIPKPHVGQYSGIKKKIGAKITVGLLQSLSRRNDLSDLRDQFGTVIVDECHHIPASTFREVICQLNPSYLYGLTATPKRKHNDEKLIYVYIGDIVAQMEAADVTPAPFGVARPAEIIVRTTNLSIPFEFSTDLFHLLAKVVCFDTVRNRMIVDDILQETRAGRKVLLLSERKEHLEILNLYLKGKCETIVISGDDPLKARESKRKQIEDGHYQAVLSTGQYFGEGVDVRGFTSLLLAFPFSFEGKLVQYLGRLREMGIQKRIIDYRDRNIPFLEKQYRQRERHYKKLSATIMTRDMNEIPFSH